MLGACLCWLGVLLYLLLHVRCLSLPVGYLSAPQQLGWHGAFPLQAHRENRVEGQRAALRQWRRERGREHGGGCRPGTRKPQALSDWRPRPRPSPRPHPAHPPWARPPPRQPRRLPAPAMVPWPCWADGAGSQAAPSAALGPAPLDAQEAAAQDQPDLSACPWPWLWPQAGLGECGRMSCPD